MCCIFAYIYIHIYVYNNNQKMAITLRVGENGRGWMEEREVEREVILFQLKPYIFIKQC